MKPGIFDDLKPKVKRIKGVSLMQLIPNGDNYFAISFASEINDPGVEEVGPLPRGISTPASLLGFISAHSQWPEAATSLLAVDRAKLIYRWKSLAAFPLKIRSWSAAGRFSCSTSVCGYSIA